MSEHQPSANAYSADEWAHFRAEDYSAGKAIVLLMVGIFSIGVVLYLLVAFSIIRHSGFIA